MQRRSSLPVFLLTLVLFSCAGNDGRVTVKEVTLDTTIYGDDEPGGPLPPPQHSVIYADLQDWFGSLCDGAGPRAEAYFFMLYPNPGVNSVLFYGTEKYNPADPQWMYRFVAETEISQNLPPEQYAGLNDEEVLKKFAAELKVFTTTDKFLNSWMSQGKAIAAGIYHGKMIRVR